MFIQAKNVVCSSITRLRKQKHDQRSSRCKPCSSYLYIVDATWAAQSWASHSARTSVMPKWLTWYPELYRIPAASWVKEFCSFLLGNGSSFAMGLLNFILWQTFGTAIFIAVWQVRGCLPCYVSWVITRPALCSESGAWQLLLSFEVRVAAFTARAPEIALFEEDQFLSVLFRNTERHTQGRDKVVPITYLMKAPLLRIKAMAQACCL